MNRLNRFLWSVAVGITLMPVAVSCSHTGNVPRPRGYFRIERSDTAYTTFRSPEGLSFPVSSDALAHLSTDSTSRAGNEWINIDYPTHNATIYCTYARMGKANIDDALRGRYTRALNNSRGATQPREVTLIDSITGISHTLLFTATGNVIPLQFITTDSCSFIFSGALFMPQVQNTDSVAPAIDIITDDIINMLQNMTINGTDS